MAEDAGTVQTSDKELTEEQLQQQKEQAEWQAVIANARNSIAEIMEGLTNTKLKEDWEYTPQMRQLVHETWHNSRFPFKHGFYPNFGYGATFHHCKALIQGRFLPTYL